MKNEWIPLTKRPPEDGERVLITYDKNVIRATWDEMRGNFYNTSAMVLDKDFVSAWMSLPEPYVERKLPADPWDGEKPHAPDGFVVKYCEEYKTEEEND